MLRPFGPWLVSLVACGGLLAHDSLILGGLMRLTNGEVRLKWVTPSGVSYRIDAAMALSGWSPLVTLAGTGTNTLLDSAAPYLEGRYYRAVPESDPGALAGDHLMTRVGDVVIHPVRHASFVMRWQDRMIYNDPVGSSSLYTGFPPADLILGSHGHGDHFDSGTLTAVSQAGTVIVAPAAVWGGMSSPLKAVTIPLANGATTNVLGLSIEAVPAFNSYHAKGSGNGYVVTFGDRRVFISGDTGNIVEMRALTDIAVAFVCMNLPWTMSVVEASTAVRPFQPKVVYPYHYGDSGGGNASDLNAFKKRVGTDLGIEVRLRKWY